VSGHSTGLRIWLLQRVSALYLGVYLVYVMTSLLLYPRSDYAAWSAWFDRPLMAISTAGFVLAVLLHGWVGLRDVILDYVHHLGLRLLLLTGMTLLLLACGLWALRILVTAAG
jgi:succinate dehydrogenase / fumarate reductase membrane anchor subunit